MPYSMDEKDKLPDYVQALDEDQQAQWVAVWNSAYESCVKDEGEDCEGSAFAQANGVVMKDEEKKNAFALLSKRAGDFIKHLLGFKERAGITVGQIYEQVYAVLEEMYAEDDMWAYLVDVYIDTGVNYAIIAKEGKLYRVPLTIDGSSVSLGEWEEVVMEYNPVRTRTTIKRTEDGKYRWFSIANSAILNRVGEIDSRNCIDSFVQYAEETGEYPYRTFYHKGEKFRIGQCDWLARDGNFLLSSGVYDDTPIAQAEIRARQEDPEYWGESIGYDALGEPEMWEASPGVKIPVYNVGILNEISTAPEKECAALYTNRTNLMEVNRMLNTREKAALVKLFGNEEEADRWLETVEGAERTVQETGQITRTDDGAESGSDAGDEVETSVETAEVSAPVLEIDDELIDEIVDRVTRTECFAGIESALSSLSETLEALQRQISANEIKSSETLTRMAQRLESVERDDSEKRAEWIEDLPERPTIKATYRPRQNAQAGEPPSFADIANNTLAKINQ